MKPETVARISCPACERPRFAVVASDVPSASGGQPITVLRCRSCRRFCWVPSNTKGVDDGC